MKMEIKRPGPKLKLREGLKGGNRKPQTFKICIHCKKEFGPVSYLGVKFCSYLCKKTAQKTGIKRRSVCTVKARNAQRLMKYYIDSGKIIRPKICEQCKNFNKRIEAAHYDYNDPLRVRWLCKSCHIKWDKADPKGGSYSELIPS